MKRLKLHFKKRVKPHHLHFAHGWLWGVVIITLGLMLFRGINDGHFRYWFGNDFDIVNIHEVIQSDREADDLFEVIDLFVGYFVGRRLDSL